jgi:hypothetical protein
MTLGTKMARAWPKPFGAPIRSCARSCRRGLQLVLADLAIERLLLAGTALEIMRRADGDRRP